MTGDRSGYLTLFLETGSGLTNAGHIQANGSDIHVNYNSNPAINDWNEDGKKDIIVGEQSAVSPAYGNIRLYLNGGTNDAPVFNDYTLLEAGGIQINRYRANPRVYDLDQDGLKDLIVGENSGMVYFYKNVGTNAEPVFNTPPEILQIEGGVNIHVSAGSRLHLVDWRGDGDPDLLISGYYGLVQLYENTTVGIQEETDKSHRELGLIIAPNPLVDKAIFRYMLSGRTAVRARVFSAEGRLVAVPINQYEESGSQQFIWNVCDDNGEKLPAGVYFIEFQADLITRIVRILVVR